MIRSVRGFGYSFDDGSHAPVVTPERGAGSFASA
jgi:hypothetical protein